MTCDPLARLMACWILVLPPGVKPGPPAESSPLNHPWSPWLVQTTEICLTVLKARSLRSKWWKGWCLLRAEREGSVPGLSCWLVHNFTSGSDGKESASNAGDPGLIPGLGRSPGEGNGNPFQYSCLVNPMDREAWWAIVHGVTVSWTQLSNWTT